MAPSQSPRATTASTLSPETAHGTHLFKIDGYSLYRGLGVGNCIHSATFTVGGCDWCVLLYPDGDNEEFEDWVSVFLELKTGEAEVRALYDLRIIDCTTRPPQPVSTHQPNPSGAEPRVFDTLDGEMCVWGHADFVRKSEIGKYIADDVLLVQCSLTVINFKAEAKMMCAAVQVPPSDMLDDLGNFLEAQEGANVSFKVKGEVFLAHKSILAARSPVFKAEFYGPMRNKSRRNVTIEDMQPGVFKALLHFIYTDSLPPMDDLIDDEHEEMVKHLLVAADRYAMERMKLVCESKLYESLHAETVATTLALADQHHCSQLKDACIEFINSSNRMNDVVASKGYEHLKRACPAIIADILEKTAKTRKI
ncbi:unnamed protein product [Alopecurus aequalis]